MRVYNKIIATSANLLRQWGYDFQEENDPLVQEMKKAIRRKGGKIDFKIEQYPDGSWTAESINFDGIITGGVTTKNISAEIKDAIFTYFGIPPHLCADTLLNADNEPVTLSRQVYV